MFEFHAWAVIHDSVGDDNDQQLASIIQALRSHIESLTWDRQFLDLRVINGQYHLLASGFTNHRDGRAEDLFDLFRWVAKAAPGSYGLLYWHDDESGPGLNNMFQVWVLARGEIHERYDPFLSPLIPVVEEPES